MKHDMIREMYKNNEQITVDMLSHYLFTHGQSDTVEVKLRGEWFKTIPVKEKYDHYTEALNPNSIDKYLKYGYFTQESIDIYNKAIKDEGLEETI